MSLKFSLNGFLINKLNLKSIDQKIVLNQVEFISDIQSDLVDFIFYICY